jgi:hypothetical protein
MPRLSARIDCTSLVGCVSGVAHDLHASLRAWVGTLLRVATMVFAAYLVPDSFTVRFHCRRCRETTGWLATLSCTFVVVVCRLQQLRACTVIVTFEQNRHDHLRLQTVPSRAPTVVPVAWVGVFSGRGVDGAPARVSSAVCSPQLARRPLNVLL